MAIFLAAFLLIGCGAKTPDYPYGDIQPVAQSVSSFAGGDRTLLSVHAQRAYAEAFDTRRFEPWQQTYEQNLSRLLWPWGVYTPKGGYGANKQPLEPEWFDTLAANAQIGSYPNSDQRAITLRRVDLRNFPTQEPYFRDFARAGEGFPFDYLQNSTLHAMTPVRITHTSAYGDWLFIESDHAHGWVRPDAVATLSPPVIEELMGAQVVAITQESSRIYGLDGRFLFEADIGTLLFSTGQDASGWRLLAVVPNTLGEGVLEPAWLIGEAKRWPLSADKQTLSSLADRMMGQRYGWGGLYGKRDCSALMRDLYTPIGRWLPRNSSQQAQAGERLDLTGLSAEERVALIQTEGRPFMTLVHFPGHIGLYLGMEGGQPLMLHSTWGHRTHARGQEGRLVIGQTVITTLKAGSGLHPEWPNGLIDRATSLIYMDKGAYHGR